MSIVLNGNKRVKRFRTLIHATDRLCCSMLMVPVMWSERVRAHSPHPSQWYSRFVPSLHLPNESIDGCVILFDFFLLVFIWLCFDSRTPLSAWYCFVDIKFASVSFIRCAHGTNGGWIASCFYRALNLWMHTRHTVPYILCIIIRCGTVCAVPLSFCCVHFCIISRDCSVCSICWLTLTINLLFCNTFVSTRQRIDVISALLIRTCFFSLPADRLFIRCFFSCRFHLLFSILSDSAVTGPQSKWFAVDSKFQSPSEKSTEKKQFFFSFLLEEFFTSRWMFVATVHWVLDGHQMGKWLRKQIK